MCRIGADPSGIARCVDSVEVNGIKPKSGDYVRVTSPYSLAAPDGKEVQVAGTLYASFENWLDSFCSHVGVIFYFDNSGKLITYHIDCLW